MIKIFIKILQKCHAMANLFVRIYLPSLAHLFVVKKMFASLHFLSLQKMCLRLLFLTDTSTALLLPLENILRCARTCPLRKNASIFIVVYCALTSIYQLCCAPQELAYFFIKEEKLKKNYRDFYISLDILWTLWYYYRRKWNVSKMDGVLRVLGMSVANDAKLFRTPLFQEM